MTGLRNFLKRLELKVLASHASTYCYNPPETVQVEITTRCNFNCDKCFRRLTDVEEKDMSLGMFQSVVEQLGQVENLYPFGRGEPLLHKELSQIIELSARHAKFVGINTNGFYLSPELAKELSASGISQITVSLDSLDSDKRVLSNVAEVASIPNIPLSFHAVLSNKNEASILELPKYASELNVKKLTFNIVKFYSELLPSNPKATLSALQRKCNLYGITTNISGLLAENKSVRFCLAPFRTCQIDVEGNMTPCCNYPHFVVGKILDENSAWNSKKFRTFRRSFLRGKLPEWCREYCIPARRLLC